MGASSGAAVSYRVYPDQSCLTAYEDLRVIVEALFPTADGRIPVARECYTITATVDGEQAGWLNLVYTVDGDALIHMVYVKPNHRGKGIGTALVAKAIEHARKHGAKKVKAVILDWHPMMEVTPTIMRHILEKFGFKHVGNDEYELELEGGGER